MQYKSALFASSLVASSLAAYVPSEPWTTLTPKAAAPSGATTDYTKTFGIAVVPITTGSASLAKRDVVSQIGDGQIQATTATTTTKQVVSQIGDGQIQATTATKQVVSQIGDGQIQATTATVAPKQVVSQIGDGQIQATTATKQVVSQIGDGQIQATTATTSTKQVVSQIGDGQIQASTKTTVSIASQIADGQIQASTTTLAPSSTESKTTATETSSSNSEIGVSCLTDESLALILEGSVLTDAKGRIGSIVANRQFQFDGPPPQAGAIYAAGWSVTEDGNLAIGDNDVFYQCLSGSFYNLYDESLGEQCAKIHLEVVDLVSC